jgi:PiT family inorganic phosphate transporter
MAMELFTEYGTLLIILAGLFGFFMAWGVGANDVANAMGTSVGSKALTIKQAILIAMVFEFAGAYLAGGEVTSTIRKGIVDTDVFIDSPDLLVFGMLSALLAAGTWLMIASFKGWPVSTTHSIVGAIVGFAAVGVSTDAVNWSKVSTIVASWVVSPVIAGTISFAIFRSVQNLILIQDDPFERAKKYAPMYMFAVGFLMAMVTILKGLKHVFKDIGVSLNFGESVVWAIMFGVFVAIIGSFLLARVERDEALEAKNRFANVERVFAVLMIFTACSMAFAHGSNDVANAVGPLAAVVNVVNSGGDIAAKSSMPSWILLLGGAGIVFGLATYGFKELYGQF